MAVTAAAAKLTLPVAYAAAPVGVKLTQHDRDDLKRIADYFNQVRSMKGRSLQVGPDGSAAEGDNRTEEHTIEFQLLMRISLAVFCLKKKSNRNHPHPHVSILI